HRARNRLRARRCARDSSGRPVNESLERTMTTTIAILAVAFVAAWFFDRGRERRLWGAKSKDDLVAVLVGAEWHHWELALEELKRRGEDLETALRRLSIHLLFGQPSEGRAAQIALMNIYPETRALLKSYRA